MLTTADKASDARADVAPAFVPEPGAGGWKPTPFQQVLCVTGVTLLGSFALALPTLVVGPIGVVLGMVAAALSVGVGTLVGMKSAGPRNMGGGNGQ